MSRDILLSLIDPDPDQPRQHFDQAAIDELAQSIAANGLAAVSYTHLTLPTSDLV